MQASFNQSLTRADIRQLVRNKRRSLSAEIQHTSAQQLSLSLQQRLSSFIAKNDTNKPINVALYLATDGELNPHPFIDWCWQTQHIHNIHVYLPVIHPFSKGNLLFLRYTPMTTMITNRYGILEPKLNVQTLCSPLNLQVLFTPLVAFDKQGNRLGMGGGFYDRTLANIEKTQQQHNNLSQTNTRLTPPEIIGLAHSCQEIEILPIEAWDMPLPEIITPEKSIKR